MVLSGFLCSFKEGWFSYDPLYTIYIYDVLLMLMKGAMMGPHWNPSTAEVAIVLHGRGMIQVVCPSLEKETMCENSKFKVEEGDVFVVPKYHPMTQISFNNDSFVFMGFTSNLRNNHPQNLAGKSSIFKMLDKWVLGKSFNVSITTIDRVSLAQRKSIILACTSCAESMEEETTGGGGEGESTGGEGGEGETTGGGGGSTGGGGGETTGGGGGGGGGEKEESGIKEEEEMGWEGEKASMEEEEMMRRQREAEAVARGEGRGRGRGGM